MAAKADVQFPGQPKSQQECENAHDKAKAEAREHHDRGVALSEQSNAVGRQRQAACAAMVHAPNNGYWRCIEPYDRVRAELHPKIMAEYAERDRISRSVHGPYMLCRQKAHSHEQQQEEQQRKQRDLQAQSERQQRELQAQTERQQRQLQAQQEARQRQEYENRQRMVEQQRLADQQRTLLDAQRQQQAQARQMQQLQQRQANVELLQKSMAQAYSPAADRAIAPKVSLETSSDMDARYLQNSVPPAADHGSTALQNQLGLSAVRTSAAAAKDPDLALPTGGVQVAKIIDKQERKVLADALNPQGDSYSDINKAVTAATRTNEAIERMRFSNRSSLEGRMVAQIGNDAITGVGAVANRALGEFDRAFAQANREPAAAGSSPLGHADFGGGRTSSLPAQGSGSDLLALLPAAESPLKTCTVLASVEVQECVKKLCQRNDFAAHADCKPKDNEDNK